MKTRFTTLTTHRDGLATWLLKSALLTITAFCAITSVASDEDERTRPRVFPIGSTPFGKTYSEWSAQWWKWAYSLPVDQNPFFDETGCQNGANGQSGPVWFLTGVINASGTAERSCSVPPGKALFFPILNFECDNVCPPIIPPLDAPALAALCKSFMDGAANVACELDGFPVRHIERYRVASAPFSVEFPDNNVFQYFGCDVSPGTYSPFVSDGIFLMLAPLSRGQHTLHFHGELPDFNFALDITYHLTVEKSPK